jgi:hypothetical protein
MSKTFGKRRFMQFAIAAGSLSVLTFNSLAQSTNSQWTYHVNEDKMRGTKSYYASLDSPTRLDFQFPYNGGSTVTLSVSSVKKDEYYVRIWINKGQFVVRSLLDVPELKFDDEPVMKLAKLTGTNNIGSIAEDGSGITLAYGSGGKRFAEKLKKSKRLVMDARFYLTERKQFEFKVEGLDLSKVPPPSKSR